MDNVSSSPIWSSEMVTKTPSPEKKSFIYNWKFWIGLALAIFLIAWIVVTFIYRPSTSNTNTSKRVKHKVYYEDSDDDYTDDDEEEEYVSRRHTQVNRRRITPDVSTEHINMRSSIPDVGTRTIPDVDKRTIPDVDKRTIPDVNIQGNMNIGTRDFLDIKLPSRTTIVDTCDDIPGPQRPSRNIDFTPDIPNYANYTGRQPERWKREGECRRILENIYGVPFTKEYPDWLVNDLTGHNLELDGYNPDLRIAFEHMGKQHYDPDDHFNKNDEEYKQMIYRDNLKARLCKENGVYLYVIPYNIPFKDLENFIRHNSPEAVAARQAREQQLAEGVNPDALSHFQQIVPKPIDPESNTRGRKPRGIKVPDHMWKR